MKKIKRKISLDKKTCQKYHFFKRIKERLNIRFTNNDYEELISTIKNNKNHPRFKIKYLLDQSKRFSLYELKIDNMEPVNVVYDKQRKSVVTVLFPMEGMPIYHFYDIFGNKINIKSEYGFGNPWRILENKLTIEGENVTYNDGIFEILSDGVLKNKKFKYEDNELYEVK